MESYQNTGYFLTVYTPLSQHLARQSSTTQVFLTLPSLVFNLTQLMKSGFRPSRLGEALWDLVKMLLLRNQVFLFLFLYYFLYVWCKNNFDRSRQGNEGGNLANCETQNKSC